MWYIHRCKTCSVRTGRSQIESKLDRIETGFRPKRSFFGPTCEFARLDAMDRPQAQVRQPYATNPASAG